MEESAFERALVDARPIPAAVVVLHVEDDLMLKLTIGARISQMGITVEQASNGDEALAIVRERRADGRPPFSFILMDNQVGRIRTTRPRARATHALLFARPRSCFPTRARACKHRRRAHSHAAPIIAPFFDVVSRRTQMPGMSGAECTVVLREEGHDGLICGITGDSADSEDAIEFVKSGLDGCLEKTPQGIDCILHILRLQLERVGA
jgi:CheY-like chemotaxis protein